MPNYRLYCINPAGDFAPGKDFDADNDAQASDRAEQLRGSNAAELWQQGRMVYFFDLGQ